MLCEVGKKPYVKEIPNELEVMHELVGGYIETAPLINGLIVVCNEEDTFKLTHYLTIWEFISLEISLSQELTGMNLPPLPMKI